MAGRIAAGRNEPRTTGVARVVEFVIRAATENWGTKIMAFVLAVIVFIVTRDEVTRSFTIPLRVIDDRQRVLLTEPPATVEVRLRGQWANVNRLSAAALGPTRAVAAMLLYLAAGVAGVPWFSQQASGIAIPTLGYIVGFVLAGAAVGALARRGADRTVLGTTLSMGVGNLIIYAVGVPYLALAVGLDLPSAMAMGLVPFLIGDALKIALAAGLLPLAWRLTSR